MVFLNRIYTRSGDEGETSLGDMSRVPKTNPRIIAYGTVDELNAVIGVALACSELQEPFPRHLRQIQNDLFDVGADLCRPEDDEPAEPPPLRVQACQVLRLEERIDEINADLAPLTSFILPGGSPAAALLHHARTICRRAEIDVWRLSESQTVNPQVLKFLNRLSDLLFVMARASNEGGQNDILWKPGQNAD